MKIGILTHYNVSSHGALLQMYGLQSELEKMGHDVFILTYNRNLDFIDDETKKRFSASFRNIPYYLKTYLLQNGLPMMLYQYRKQKVLGKFRNQRFSFMHYAASGELDCVVVGADEVFALENGINIMMFGHGVTAPKIIAYAPSFGQTDIDRIEKFGYRELIASGLNKFSTLSARDMGSQRTIKQLIDTDVKLVCDPALLHDFGRIHKETNKKKYIVVYSYQSNFKEKERIKAIRKYAQDQGCELWSAGVYFKWCDKKINCDPLKMIQVFANAQAVITDTFHGTIMAYIAHTPMAVFVRSNNNVKLDHLLGMLHLENRKVKKTAELENVLKSTMDFTIVDEQIATLRADGMIYLKNTLEQTLTHT